VKHLILLVISLVIFGFVIGFFVGHYVADRLWKSTIKEVAANIHKIDEFTQKRIEADKILEKLKTNKED